MKIEIVNFLFSILILNENQMDDNQKHPNSPLTLKCLHLGYRIY